MTLRLQKFLADHGVCSRRKAEELIVEGRVRVNNAVVTELGTKVDPEHDLVAVNKRPINRPQQLVYIALHKPVGVVTSCAQENEVTVRHLVQVPWRVVPAGRLDKDSSGLVLLTNDGPLVHRLTHPRFAHEKEYLVTAARMVTDGELGALARGIALDDGPTQPCAVQRVAARRFRIILREGRNRQIRRMCFALHLEVAALHRTRVATLTLRDLPPAHWRHLTHRERDQLLALVQTEPAQSIMPPKAPPRRRAMVRPPCRPPLRDGARPAERDGARPTERDGARPPLRDGALPPPQDAARAPARAAFRPNRPHRRTRRHTRTAERGKPPAFRKRGQ